MIISKNNKFIPLIIGRSIVRQFLTQYIQFPVNKLKIKRILIKPPKMTNTFFKLESFKNTPDIYYNQKNPLADLNKMMMYVWSKSLSLSYKFEDEILFVIGVFQGIPYLWGPPVGEKITITHIFNGVDMIQNLRDQLGIKTDEPEILYLWNEYELFDIIKSNEKFNVWPQAQEYIYDPSQLACLNKPTLRSKRKSKNRFVKKFNPEIKLFSPVYKTKCIELIDKWKVLKLPKIDKENENKFLYELTVCREALSQDLPFEGVIGFIGDQIIGFSVGYKHTFDTFNCMFEKTDLSYPDASSYIFSELGNALKNKYNYINAGEDWGIDYLARTKKKWMPIKTISSYSIKMLR